MPDSTIIYGVSGNRIVYMFLSSSNIMFVYSQLKVMFDLA